jgi:hypothetical protein
VASIRAAQLQHSLAAIERIAEGAHERVFARMQPETRARIRAASWIDWLPIELDLELAEAVAAELGPAADRQRARMSIQLSVESPLLRPFIVGVQTSFTLEPGSVIRQAPRGWLAIYKSAGTLEYQIGQGAERVLVYSDIPAQVVASALYLDAIAGAFESLFDLCRVEGSVSVEAVDPRRRRAELRFSWY